MILTWLLFAISDHNFMRPVPTKWEKSRKIPFPSYNQIHVAQTWSFKMIYYMSGLLPYLGSKNPLFHWEIPLVSTDFWNVQWAISPLVPWQLNRSFCENKSHLSIKDFEKAFTYLQNIVVKAVCFINQIHSPVCHGYFKFPVQDFTVQFSSPQVWFPLLLESENPNNRNQNEPTVSRPL